VRGLFIIELWGPIGVHFLASPKIFPNPADIRRVRALRQLFQRSNPQG
jgi:hypothetical protein